MVFTQRPLSLGEWFGHERRHASVTFFSDGDGGTPSISVQATNLWYDMRDTYIVRFVVVGFRKNLPLAARRPMADDSNSLSLSFTTNGREHIDSIRLQIAAAIQSAGAEIDTKTPVEEGDRVFYGLRDGVPFTVVIAEMPNHCLVSMEGSTAEEKVNPIVRAWAQPIIEAAVRSCDETDNVRWHDSSQMLG